ncbi:MAG: hypothetical protein DHS80DRAFT_24686 [Piptocephalis tieghemiana]|nr:MAG: hypothetical protein DHS80DRAFT_24686 [Piptocephalis tieghemiana]
MKPTSAALFLLIALLASTAVCALPGIRPWTPEDNNAPSSQGTSRRSPSPIEGRVARRRRLSSSSRSSPSSSSRERSRSPSRSHMISVSDDMALQITIIFDALLDGDSNGRNHEVLLEVIRAFPPHDPLNDGYMRRLARIRTDVERHLEGNPREIRIGNSSPGNIERINWMHRLTEELYRWFQDYASSYPSGMIGGIIDALQLKMDQYRQTRNNFSRHG